MTSRFTGTRGYTGTQTLSPQQQQQILSNFPNTTVSYGQNPLLSQLAPQQSRLIGLANSQVGRQALLDWANHNGISQDVPESYIRFAQKYGQDTKTDLNSAFKRRYGMAGPATKVQGRTLDTNGYYYALYNAILDQEGQNGNVDLVLSTFLDDKPLEEIATERYNSLESQIQNPLINATKNVATGSDYFSGYGVKTPIRLATKNLTSPDYQVYRRLTNTPQGRGAQTRAINSYINAREVVSLNDELALAQQDIDNIFPQITLCIEKNAASPQNADNIKNCIIQLLAKVEQKDKVAALMLEKLGKISATLPTTATTVGTLTTIPFSTQ